MYNISFACKNICIVLQTSLVYMGCRAYSRPSASELTNSIIITGTNNIWGLGTKGSRLNCKQKKGTRKIRNHSIKKKACDYEAVVKNYPVQN